MVVSELDATLDWIESAVDGFSSRFRSYLDGLGDRDSSDAISAGQRALIRLAIALTLPNTKLVNQASSEARAYASADEIKHAVCVAANLRAGAAIAYGRLAFKMLDPASPVVTSAAEQIKADREYMTHFRKGSPPDFDGLLSLLGASQRAGLPLPRQTQELIAVGCATVTQCVYCMEKHVKAARDSGVTMKQISQAVHLAVAMRMEATLLEAQAFA